MLTLVDAAELEAKPEVKIDALVTPITSHHPMLLQLQTELRAVIMQKKFEQMDNATLVGILEYVKWNIINCSN